MTETRRDDGKDVQPARADHTPLNPGVALSNSADHYPDILRVPNEILHTIFVFATFYTTANCNPDSVRTPRLRVRAFEERCSTAASIARTCRRFHPIATPLLYAELHVTTHHYYDNQPERAREKVLALHRTLRETASLRTHCEFLVLEVKHETELHAALDLVRWLTGASRLELRTILPLTAQEWWPLFEAVVDHIPDLRELTLLWDLTSYCLGALCAAILRLRSLRVLCLRGINSLNGSCADLVKGTGPLTSLELLLLNGQTDREEALIAWPAALEHLSLSAHLVAIHHGPYTLYDLAPGLSHVSHSLRTLRIGYLPESDLSDFSLEGFGNLEELEIWSGATGTDATEVGNLLAPRLRKFTWTFGQIFKENSFTWQVFGQPEEDWLFRLVGLAKERGLALSEVHVKFYSWNPSMAILPDVYQWDRLQGMVGGMWKAGIKLTYSPSATERSRFYGLEGIGQE